MTAEPNKFYITTPIYYVNDAPHIGHAYTTILADVLSRYSRLLGTPTHFLTGTDEHGQKVFEAARKGGITPQEHADQTVVRFQELWERLGVSHDDFIRTTEERHNVVVQKILQDLHERDEIYEGNYEGWYSVSEERFYTDKDLIDGKSPEGKPVEKVMEKNYFFRMSKYQEWLIDYIEQNPEFIRPKHRRNETLGYLQKPLGDLCISRPKTRMPWGIELPFDSDYVCYVWFDALVNYISAIGYGQNDEQFKKWWPATYHLIGKDILATHTVYWPTMLKAMGVPQPCSVFAHGWWLTSGEKMSKSDGNVINPMDMIDRYGVDALRYYLMAEMTLGQDATFTEKGFIERYNSDLANDLGNMASRALKMLDRHFEGRIPLPGPLTAAEDSLRDDTLRAVKAMEESIPAMRLDQGIGAVIDAVRSANRYFESTAPWTVAKSGDMERLATILYSAAECLRIISGLLYPVIPEKMTELRVMLGIEKDGIEPSLKNLAGWGGLTPQTPLGKAATLFPRVDVKKKSEQPQKPKKDVKKKMEASTDKKVEEKKESAPEDGLLDIKDFFKVQLRVAQILEAEKVPKADKLLQLQIDLGEEKRQLVAGIAEHYEPEALIGKKIVVVANLKPAKIRGVVSNGMLLAARDESGVKILTIDGDALPGSEVS